MFHVPVRPKAGAANAAAVVAAPAFTFSGFIIAWFGYPHANSAVLLPMLFYFAEGVLRDTGDRRSWAGLAAAFGASLLGGHAPTVVHMTIALGLYALVRLGTASRRARITTTASLAAAPTAGALIASPQLLPFAEYYRLSSSRQSSEALNRWASHLQPAALVSLILPYSSGGPRAGFEAARPDAGRTVPDVFNERTGYVGVLTLFLALVALTRRRDRYTLYFGGIVLLAGVGIFGIPPWPSVVRRLPVLSSINHERLILWADWGLAVLAGLGADALVRVQPNRRPFRLAMGFVLALAAAATLPSGSGQIDAIGRPLFGKHRRRSSWSLAPGWPAPSASRCAA